MEETVDRVRESFSRSPCKSIRQASRELGIPHSTVHDIVHKCLHLHAYKLQLLHHIKPDDHRKRTYFAVEMLSCIQQKKITIILIWCCSVMNQPFTCVGKSTSITVTFGVERIHTK
jgi:hypothetical protein